MAGQALNLQVVTIKQAVTSASTCDSRTVATLSKLLSVGDNASTKDSTSWRKNQGLKSSSLQSHANKPATRSRKQVEVNSGADSENLALVDRIVLATEVANATLKALTEDIKSKTDTKPGEDTEHHKRGHSRTSSSNGGPNVPARPLHLRSVSRLTKPPSKDPSPRSLHSESRDKSQATILPVARCARVAFAALRKYERHQEDTGKKKFSAFQLETGMSALIGKLVALGLDDLAVKELRILMRRLCVLQEPSGYAGVDKELLTDCGSSETLTDLLRISKVPTDRQRLLLLVTSQIHIIKLLSMRKDSQEIQAALEHVEPSRTGAPTNVIDYAVHQLPELRDKMAKNLAALAQLMLSFCPSPSSQEDVNVSNGDWTSPEVTLAYQIQAHQARWKSWNLSGHRSDVRKELFDPLERQLRAYARRSKEIPSVIYETACHAVKNISELVLENRLLPELACSINSALLPTHNVLAELAGKTRDSSNVLHWLTQSLSILRSQGASQAAQCTFLCHICRSTCQDIARSPTILPALKSLEEVASFLTDNLHGTLEELDELLVAVASLQKPIVSILVLCEKKAKDTSVGELQEFPRVCQRLILSYVSFVIRYMSGESDAPKRETSTSGYTQRMQLAAKAARQAIDSVVFLARHPPTDNADSWLAVDAGLQDCARLAEIIEENDPLRGGPEEEQNALQSPFIVLSNAYWCRYLQRRSQKCDREELISLLQISVNLINKRNIRERCVGLLTIKLEKLGDLYAASNEETKARSAWEQALRHEIASENVLHAAQKADHDSIDQVLSLDGDFTVLARLLSSYAKAFKCDQDHRQPTDHYFDDIQLHPAARGLILEAQLDTLTATLAKGTKVDTSSILRTISQALLSIYTIDNYPIRRVRVIVLILRGQLIDSTIYGQETTESLQKESEYASTTEYQHDAGLMGFLDHLRASRDAYLAMLNGRMDLFLGALDTWSKIVHESVEWPLIKAKIDNVPQWINDLGSIAEYLQMQGHELERARVLETIVLVNVRMASTQKPSHVSKLCELGLQLARMGHSNKAGMTFQAAYSYLEELTLPQPVAFQCHLAYAEYLLSIGSHTKAEEFALKARDTIKKSMQPKNVNTSFSIHLSEVWAAAEITYLLSLLSTANGSYVAALLYGRASTRSTYRAWTLLQRQHTGKTTGSKVEDLNNNMATTSLASAPVVATKDELLSTIPFWPLVSRLFSRLLHLSTLLSHGGILPEAQYYDDQAFRIAKAVQAQPLLMSAKLSQGRYDIARGLSEQGLNTLKEAMALMKSDALPTIVNVNLYIALGKAYMLDGDYDAQDIALRRAEDITNDLLRAATSDDHESVRDKLQLDDVLSRVENLTISGKSHEAEQHVQGRTSSRRGRSNTAVSTRKAKDTSEPSPSLEPLPLQRLQAHLFRELACHEMGRREYVQATAYLSRAEKLATLRRDSIEQSLGQAKILLAQCLESLATDPVLSVLPESTLSCPSTALAGRGRSRDLLNRNALGNDNSIQVKKTKSGGPARIKESTKTNEFCGHLDNALDTLNHVIAIAQTEGSSILLHEISNVLSKTSLMLSAGFGTYSMTVTSTCAIYFMELGRLIARIRDQSTIQAEKLLAADKDYDNTLSVCGPVEDLSSFHIDISTFQADYVDIIPDNWTVVSISISGNCDELRLAKIRSGQPPFVLVIPLNRHSLQDYDEEAFDFEQGKTELQDIVALANYSTHDARDMSKKGAKTEWWKARTALDERLGELLVNIENIWLGGFRGIFAQQEPRRDLLSRFQQSFYNTLDKHLPSRCKGPKAAKASRVRLDSRVLELLVGLGNPTKVKNLEEPLLDLLYFIVDILQFNGERNAYDEIDFDSIVIETLDALGQYHEAARDDANDARPQHTILILDKALHCFPWESLPCMSGKATSRLPSLACLRTRILKQRQQRPADSSAEPSEAGLRLDSADGAYILNPSGDLAATQATFSAPLASLKGWSATVDRAPTESEIADHLSSRSLYLYFGHGSGGQYVRARTVRKLDCCAVALLMGCSSGAVAEAGEYESHGTPLNYLAAGAQAVVGTLWDVTDKDIDRFSLRVLERWGLLAEEEGEEAAAAEDGASGKRRRNQKAGARGKGKARAKSRAREKEEEEEGEEKVAPGGGDKVSLDAAVAEARRSCLMRYLNGAAPVVYGVPVFVA